MSGYKVEKPTVVENTSGIRDGLASAAIQGNLATSHGAQKFEVGMNDTTMQCVNLGALGTAAQGLDTVECQNPDNPKERIKVQVRHGATGPS